MARILVIDADVDVRAAAEAALNGDHQHSVEVTADLPTALRILARHRTDLIVADLGQPPHLPDHNILATLAAAAPMTPVLGAAELPYAWTLDPATLGIAGLLVKPFTQRELHARIADALAGQRRSLRQRQRMLESAEAHVATAYGRVLRSSILLGEPLADAQIDGFLATPEFAAALRDHLWLQANLQGLDVGADRSWQQTFTRRYRLRLPSAGSYRRSFQLLEQLKSRAEPYPVVLAALQRATGRVEPASASKLLAMLDPQMPVLDHALLATFGLKRPPRGSQDVAQWSALYQDLVQQYTRLAQEPLGIQICQRFAIRYPAAPIPDLKKLDLVLWQAHVLGQSAAEPPPVAGAQDAVTAAFGPRYWAMVSRWPWWPRRQSGS